MSRLGFVRGDHGRSEGIIYAPGHCSTASERVDLKALEIPLLPGMSMHDPYQNGFNKSHSFGFSKTPLGAMAHYDMYDERKFGLKHMSQAHVATLRQDPNQPKVPAWVALDRKVLCFDAYFREAVPESNLEMERVRHVRIHYYLEDDSLSIDEKNTEDAAMKQGTMLKRMQVARDGSYNGESYGLSDLFIGNELLIYGKVFRIADCDTYTRNFMNKYGYMVGNPEEQPQDSYTAKRIQQRLDKKPTRPRGIVEGEFKLKQFLENDRQVLSFKCVWDDTKALYGEKLPYVLNYFLADDTIEVLEVRRVNSGRGDFPALLKRSKLARDETVVQGSIVPIYYTAEHLGIGWYINVLGRNMLMYDCDPYTRQWYEQRGVSFDPPIDISEPSPPKQRLVVPEHDGLGTEEDSISSFLFLKPRIPRKEPQHPSFAGRKTSFAARLDTNVALDVGRRFIITFFLEDSTMAIFEPPIKNSGLLCGQFLKRQRVKKPDSAKFYQVTDLYKGAVINVHSTKFFVMGMDKASCTTLEELGVMNCEGQEFKENVANAQ